MTTRTAHCTHRHFVAQDVQTRDLPDGICGRVTGVALVYGERDAYNTEFQAGCLDRTKREKVPAGRVALFLDHSYGVRHHVGTVRTLETQGSQEHMMADLLDTDEGRKAKEYLSAVVRSQSKTGLSIGFFSRADKRMPDGSLVFTEVELDEISITPRPAVPGADVTSIRQDPATAWRLFDALVAVLPQDELTARITALRGDASAKDTGSEERTSPDPDAPPADSPIYATMEARRQALASALKET